MPSKQDEFEDYSFKEITYREGGIKGNIIKSKEVQELGRVKIEVDEELKDGVKVLLRKDESDNVKEIKFICSCGETKTIVLDYSEE